MNRRDLIRSSLAGIAALPFLSASNLFGADDLNTKDRSNEKFISWRKTGRRVIGIANINE